MPKFNLPKRARTMALIISVAALASASLFATGPSATPEAPRRKLRLDTATTGSLPAGSANVP